MIVSITRLKLRSAWKLGSFMSYTAKAVQQLNKSKCVNFKANIGLTDHYTLSIWENRKDMLEFSRSGDHAKAVKNARRIASEIRIYEMEGNEFPNWKTAKSLVNEKGKRIEYK